MNFRFTAADAGINAVIAGAAPDCAYTWKGRGFDT
jgi:hypothetical protein